MTRLSAQDRGAGIAQMLALVRLVAAGGATPEALASRLGCGIATVYRLRRGLEALGVRIEWRADHAEYRIAEWGVLDRRALLAGR